MRGTVSASQQQGHVLLRKPMLRIDFARNRSGLALALMAQAWPSALCRPTPFVRLWLALLA